MPRAGWKKLSAETRLAKMWYIEDHLEPPGIADRLKRDKSVITQLLAKQTPRLQQGAPPRMTSAHVDFLAKRLDEMVVKADCKYYVPVTKLKRSTRARASGHAILRALHKRNSYFHKLREGPTLTDDDMAPRLAFAKKYRGRTEAWWISNIRGQVLSPAALINGRMDAR